MLGLRAPRIQDDMPNWKQRHDIRIDPYFRRVEMQYLRRMEMRGSDLYHVCQRLCADVPSHFRERPTMFISFRDQMLPLLGSALLSISAALPAQAGDGHDVYRCRVLGERSACEQLPVSTTGEAVVQLAPGSHARYLIHIGHPVDQAIAEARASGEEPTLQVVRRDVPLRLTGVEAHERYVRGAPAPSEARDAAVANRTLPVAR
jgi:hypothetical protein